MSFISQFKYRCPDDIDEEEFPFFMEIFKRDLTLSFDSPLTVIVGDNGTGKSTIIEALADLVGLNAEGGSKNNNFNTRSDSSKLAEHCSLVKRGFPRDSYFYRAETYFNLAGEIDDLGVSDDLFDKNLHSFSRGEGFLQLINRRFFGNGLYVLDEPETGLSFSSQLAALVRINDLIDKNSQFIIASHSPIFILHPEAQIIQLTPTEAVPVEADDCSIINDWDFLLKNRAGFIKRLLS